MHIMFVVEITLMESFSFVEVIFLKGNRNNELTFRFHELKEISFDVLYIRLMNGITEEKP